MTDELPPLPDPHGQFMLYDFQAKPNDPVRYRDAFTADQMRARDAMWAERVAAAVAIERSATKLCEKHKPNGGTRSLCVICAGEKLQAALSRISYLCGEPNDMQCSEYDVHMSEDAVVEQVAATLRKRSDV